MTEEMSALDQALQPDPGRYVTTVRFTSGTTRRDVIVAEYVTLGPPLAETLNGADKIATNVARARGVPVLVTVEQFTLSPVTFSPPTVVTRAEPGAGL